MFVAGQDGSSHTFSSCDPDVMLLMPACIREQYPFQLTAKSGVSSEVCDLIFSAAAKGQSFSGIQRTVDELHKLQFHRKDLVFADILPRVDPASSTACSFFWHTA